MIYLILIAFAAMLNAAMDLTENTPAFNKSVFRNLPKQFWLKEESWKYAIKVFGWKADAWHIAKSLMIISLCLSIVLYEPAFTWYWDFLIAGAGWNLSFNLFYNKIFIK